MTVSKPRHIDRLNQKSRRASGKCIESPPLQFNQDASTLNPKHSDMSYTTNYLQSDRRRIGTRDHRAWSTAWCRTPSNSAPADLHIEPWEKAIEVRARVNGVLTEVAHLPLDLLDKSRCVSK